MLLRPDSGTASATYGRYASSPSGPLAAYGDTGGVQDAEYQNNVAGQMIEHLTNGEGPAPQFCYHVGDVVYFTGMHDDYYGQFYEPYFHYAPPIFSIPGNHDGEVRTDADSPSLSAFKANFCQTAPGVPEAASSIGIYREMAAQPGAYWMLDAPFVRDAVPADHPAIRDVVAAAYRQYADLIAPDVFARYLADLLDLDRHARHGRLLVAEAAARVCGFAAFYPDASVQGFGLPAGWASGRALAVHPAARGYGVARRGRAAGPR